MPVAMQPVGDTWLFTLPVSHTEMRRQLVICGLMLSVCLEVCLILLCLASCCTWLVLALRGASRRRAVGGSLLPTRRWRRLLSR